MAEGVHLLKERQLLLTTQNEGHRELRHQWETSQRTRKSCRACRAP